MLNEKQEKALFAFLDTVADGNAFDVFNAGLTISEHALAILGNEKSARAWRAYAESLVVESANYQTPKQLEAIVRRVTKAGKNASIELRSVLGVLGASVTKG